MSTGHPAEPFAGLASDLLPHRHAAGSPPAVVTALGADPGDTTAFLLATWENRRLARVRCWQVNADGAGELLEWVLSAYGHLIGAAGIEEFRRGPRSTALRGTSASSVARQVDALAGRIRAAGIAVAVRPASTVKTWATDKKLDAAGLLAATSGMPKHARDAGRHSLFTACENLGMPDPVSRARPPDREGARDPV